MNDKNNWKHLLRLFHSLCFKAITAWCFRRSILLENGLRRLTQKIATYTQVFRHNLCALSFHEIAGIATQIINLREII